MIYRETDMRHTDFLPFRGKPGETFRPSNGTEGEYFMAAWCDLCRKNREWRESDSNPCEILCKSTTSEVPEWKYDADGIPCCSEFAESDRPQSA
jgi:hypothetical protein